MDVTEYRKRYEAELAKAAARPQRAGEQPARTRPRAGAPSAAARAKAIETAPLDEERLRRAGRGASRHAARSRGAADASAWRRCRRSAPSTSSARASRRSAPTTSRRCATSPPTRRGSCARARSSCSRSTRIRTPRSCSSGGWSGPKEALVLRGEGDPVPRLRRPRRGRPAGADRSTSARPARHARRRSGSSPPIRKSERLFTRLLKDKSEKSSIRRISASGLQSLNPEAFERTARRIVADESDYNEIRATSLAALAHGREAREKPADPKLVETVQKVSETTRSRRCARRAGASCIDARHDGAGAPARDASAADLAAHIDATRQRPDAPRRARRRCSPSSRRSSPAAAPTRRSACAATSSRASRRSDCRRRPCPSCSRSSRRAATRYTVAAAARALRGATDVPAEAPALLVGAIARLRDADDVVSFERFAPSPAGADAVTALAELARTLALLGPARGAGARGPAGARPTAKARRFSPAVRAELAKALDALARPDVSAAAAAAGGRRRTGRNRAPARRSRGRSRTHLADLALENQDGSASDLLRGVLRPPDRARVLLHALHEPREVLAHRDAAGAARATHRRRTKLDANVAGISYDPGFDRPARLQDLRGRPRHGLLAALLAAAHRRPVRSARGGVRPRRRLRPGHRQPPSARPRRARRLPRRDERFERRLWHEEAVLEALSPP